MENWEKFENAMNRCDNDYDYNNLDYEQDAYKFYIKNKIMYDIIKPNIKSYVNNSDYIEALQNWENHILCDYEKTLK